MHRRHIKGLQRISTTKITDTITAFVGSLTPLSNFHPIGVEYYSPEHFLHHNKSMLFKDDKSAARIMSANTAAQSKM